LPYPGDEGLKIWKTKDIRDDGYNMNQLSLNMHLGTHIDFKSHVFDYKARVTDFTRFIGKANVIKPFIHNGVVDTLDLTSKLEKMKYLEKILILDLSHARNLNKEDYYSYPRFSKDIISVLKDYSINVLGADIPSFDYQAEKSLQMHKDLLSNDIYVVENLVRVDELKEHVFFIALPLKIEGLEASMTRAIARNL